MEWGDSVEKSFFKREELVGKLVIDQEACIEGKIKDLALTENGKMGLLIEREEDVDMLIDLENIQKISDVVLLKPERAAGERPIRVEAPPPPAEPEPEPPKEPVANVCQSCGHENRPNSTFCVKCGKPL